ncbi:MAG TPA: glycosyltransferase family 39 protein [Bryobacteraceae bacterium]|nr:glycosyltransferase family 39 protein [Bryobacteraceae bacterium]
MQNPIGQRLHRLAAVLLLLVMFFLAGGAALRESATVDEIAHVGAGLSYLQRLDLRLNPEHPPLAKLLAAIPLTLRGTHADYSSNAWNLASDFFPAYMTQWMFGDAVLGRWNPWRPTLLWARLPMLILTLLLGWVVYVYATRLGGLWGGLLCLSLYVSTPAFLVFGPLVITDLPVTLFSVIALWQLGEIWASPSRRNALLFGLALAAALLSKFTGVLIFPIILALFIQTRFWPTAAEPRDKAERKLWRRARWRIVLRGVFWSALAVYIVYLAFSLNQPDDVLNRIGSGPWAALVRRPLMPIWLYIRGLLFMLVTAGSRPTFLFGRTFPHGEPFYFPVVLAFKSTLGFLLLLVLAAVLAIARRFSVSRRALPKPIPDAYRPHWRVLMVGFFVFLAVCLLSRLDISIRHFSIPIVLLIVMLAPPPNMIQIFSARRFLYAATAALAASSLIACIAAYPYFFPFVNSLAMGHPAYALLNDSNVSWNEALPAVEAFAQQHHLSQLPLDWASLSDPALVVPQAQPWDCQAPTTADAGRWVAVAAVSILENRNCGYLLQYPHQALAGGSFYAFQLPQPIPAAGAPGGPPPPSARKEMWGVGFDLRAFALDAERHPETLPTQIQRIMQRFTQQRSKKGP